MGDSSGLNSTRLFNEMSFLSKHESIPRETSHTLSDIEVSAAENETLFVENADSRDATKQNSTFKDSGISEKDSQNNSDEEIFFKSSKKKVQSVDRNNDSEHSTTAIKHNSELIHSEAIKLAENLNVIDNPVKSDSEDEIFLKSSSKSRIRNIVDSDEDSEHSTNIETSSARAHPKSNGDLELSDDSVSKKSDNPATKSNKRIRKQLDSSTDESADSDNGGRAVQSSRIEDRRNKFAEKFKKIFAKSKKSPEKIEQITTKSKDVVLKVKAPKSKLSDVIDSESSDDDSESKSEQEGVQESREIPKKLYEKNDQPKVQRLSAKQAMEQMQKIKSESGRMLREKQVTLPYHRPKHVSLKDILATKKINFIPGSKRMGFKMNEDQLKEYAEQLKEREKEMLELCKSESESEEDENTSGNCKQEGEKSDDKVPEANTYQNDAMDVENPQTSEEKPSQIIDACKNLLEIFQKEENISTPDVGNNTDIISAVNNDSEIDYLTSENISDKAIVNKKADVDDEDTESKPIYEKSLSPIDKNLMDISKSIDSPESLLKDIAVENEDVTIDVQMTPADSNEKCNDEENTELFDSEIYSNSNDARKDFYIARSKTQSDESEPTTSFQNISCSAPLPNVKPRLTGSPGCFIDLMSGEVQSGVELLKKKYLLHAAMKTPEEIEREKERRIQPGSSLFKLKRDLENKMTEHRTQEWTKRAEEMALKKKEDNDNLSDYEELLEKEELETCKNDGDELQEKNDESESGEESEPEEDDVLIKSDKPKKMCGYLDEEAEVEDDEDAGSDDEDENEHSSSSESSDDEENRVPQEGKRTLTRIIKAFDSSDDETQNENKLENNTSLDCSSKPDNKESEDMGKIGVLSTPMKKDRTLQPTQSEELFPSQEITKNDTNFSLDWEDHLPLGQVPAQPCATPLPLKKNGDHFFSEPTGDRTEQGRSDLSSLVSPIIKLTAVQRMSSGNVSMDQTPSPRNTLSSPKYKSPHEADKFANLQKKLLFETESSERLQDTQELEDLCSGKFPSQNLKALPTDIALTAMFNKNTLGDDTEMTQNTENELLELCTGKFAGLNDSGEAALPLNNESAGGKDDSQNISLIWSEPQNTETYNVALSTIASEHKSGEIEKCNDVKDSSKATEEETIEDAKNLNAKCNIKSKEKSITSFFKSSNKECKVLVSSLGPIKETEPSVNVINADKKFYILSTSEEEDGGNGDENRKVKNKVLKSRKDRGKKRKQLKISDDEESEDEEKDDMNSIVDNEEAQEDRLVEYDSEENEIEVRPEISELGKPKKKMTWEFLDREAELTSEDEWRASGDEDERGLDQMEREEGDADQFDQRAMKKQLERIHLRQILDDDKREVQMLQEMLLEDDMEGGTRERKFRWKNVDSSVEVGATVGDDDIDGGVMDELQSEEQWRKQRHERETFLRQLMEKENLQKPNASQGSESSIKGVSRTSFIKSCLIKTQITKYASSIEVTSSEIALKPKEQNVHLSSNGEAVTVSNGATDNVKGKKTNDLPEPVKKPFLMQNNVRGSFLSRGQAAMNRLALLTKNGPQAQDSDEPTNLSSLAPGKKKNFVFATVSPPCNDDSLSEETKMIKRKATSDISTPTLIKKVKITENTVIKSRKSLLDHLE